MSDFAIDLESDELLSKLMLEINGLTLSLVEANAKVVLRLISMWPDDGERPNAQYILSEMNKHIGMDICISAMDIINPNWKEEAEAMLLADSDVEDIIDRVLH